MGITNRSGGGVQAGTVMHFAASTAPAGWLKANGAAVSRTLYAALFAAIGTTYGAGDGSTTFNLPDTRGEFLRSWDDSRGVDAGRTIGSAQADEFRSHSHVQQTHATTGAVVSVQGNASLSGAQAAAQSTMNSGGNETRPRNVAMLACIKY